jgi:ABC-2 family transporter protein
MIWLVWRQHRKQALFALLGLAALAAFLVPTGMQMHDAFQRSGLDDCLPVAARVEFVRQGLGPNADQANDRVRACQELADQFAGRYGSLGAAGILLWFLPLLAGMFWGAPLVAREVEHGTHRLVWTQGVSRRRWALVKFGLVGAGVVLAAACYALLVTWWRAPLDLATGQRFLSPGGSFDLVGLVPVGYALFALALGVFAGVLTRKTMPAMAITLVGFLAARLLVQLLARPRFLAPLRRTFPVAGTAAPNQLTGDWLLGAGVYDAQGTLRTGGTSGATFGDSAQAVCGTPPDAPPDPLLEQCLANYGPGAYNQEVFQPAERFWLFQTIETALFIAVAVLLLLAAVHWVRRRIS